VTRATRGQPNSKTAKHLTTREMTDAEGHRGDKRRSSFRMPFPDILSAVHQMRRRTHPWKDIQNRAIDPRIIQSLLHYVTNSARVAKVAPPAPSRLKLAICIDINMIYAFTEKLVINLI